MDSLTLVGVGAAYGTSIAVGISRRAWQLRSRSDGLLALLFSCAITAVLAITLQHRFAGPHLSAVLERIEYVATLTSGPVLLFYVRSLQPGYTPSRVALLQLTPALCMAVAPAFVSVPIAAFLLHQMTYTALSLGSRAQMSMRRRCHNRLSWGVLATMLAIHLAQIVRFAAPGKGPLRDIVPATISLIILLVGLLLVVTWIAPARSRMADGAAPPIPNCRRIQTDRAILTHLDDLLREQQVYRRRDLGLHQLAHELGVTSHELSHALNAVGKTTLNDLLARWRLRDAQRRLVDPEHDRFTIEAIGTMSGFGSRSSFYQVFRRELGTTPTRYRHEHRSS